MNVDQLTFRMDHKLYCMERAIERCDYDSATILSAQSDYYAFQIAKQTGVGLEAFNPENGRRIEYVDLH